FPIEHDGGTRESAGTERHHIDALVTITHPLFVPLEHFQVGKKMMGKKDGLASLQVRVAGNDSLWMIHRESEERILQRCESLVDRLGFRPAKETNVECDLIIAAAGGMEFCSRGSDFVGQSPLDIHVNIFKASLKAEFTRFDL